ncbi:receptor activity-modifying protein 2 isoform 4-T4 [Anomaloglossus baeobatrachus]
MESTVLCMLTSALCLFTWALGLMAAVENSTQSTVNVTNVNWEISNATVRLAKSADPYHKQVEKCWNSFNAAMFNIEQEYWCNWDYTFRMPHCSEIC